MPVLSGIPGGVGSLTPRGALVGDGVIFLNFIVYVIKDPYHFSDYVAPCFREWLVYVVQRYCKGSRIPSFYWTLEPIFVQYLLCDTILGGCLGCGAGGYWM